MKHGRFGLRSVSLVLLSATRRPSCWTQGWSRACALEIRQDGGMRVHDSTWASKRHRDSREHKCGRHRTSSLVSSKQQMVCPTSELVGCIVYLHRCLQQAQQFKGFSLLLHHCGSACCLIPVCACWDWCQFCIKASSGSCSAKGLLPVARWDDETCP